LANSSSNCSLGSRTNVGQHLSSADQFNRVPQAQLGLELTQARGKVIDREPDRVGRHASILYLAPEPFEQQRTGLGDVAGSEREDHVAVTGVGGEALYSLLH